MILQTVVLQNFRSYESYKVELTHDVTVIVGANTAGKTNLIEAIWLLAAGKSFRVEKDIQMIHIGREIARVKGLIREGDEKVILEVVLASSGSANGRFLKRFMVNDIPKRRSDFAGLLPAVLFSPEELELVNSGPSLRRKFLDSVLEQVDQEYRYASSSYEKALKQRNALLGIARETGKRNDEQFAYWDDLLITNGTILTKKREAFISYLHDAPKDIFSCTPVYNHSIISHERLRQYEHAEISAGVTLVGPHRDDMQFLMGSDQEVKYYGSRGQQRLVVLQLKLLQLMYIQKHTGKKPLFLLDDIFSELDESHMQLVMQMIRGLQAVMTTTHKEFIGEAHIEHANVLKLNHAAI